MAVKLCHWFHKHQQCWKHLGRISLMKLIEPGHSGIKMLFDLMKSWLFLVGILSLVFPMKQASRIHYCIYFKTHKQPRFFHWHRWKSKKPLQLHLQPSHTNTCSESWIGQCKKHKNCDLKWKLVKILNDIPKWSFSSLKDLNVQTFRIAPNLLGVFFLAMIFPKDCEDSLKTSRYSWWVWRKRNVKSIEIICYQAITCFIHFKNKRLTPTWSYNLCVSVSFKKKRNKMAFREVWKGCHSVGRQTNLNLCKSLLLSRRWCFFKYKETGNLLRPYLGACCSTLVHKWVEQIYASLWSETTLLAFSM